MIEIIKFNLGEFEEFSGIKRVQNEKGEPLEYNILYEEDMPNNDEAYDCFGNKEED